MIYKLASVFLFKLLDFLSKKGKKKMSLAINFKESEEKRTLNARQTAAYDNLFGKKKRETVKQDSFIQRIVLKDSHICKTCSIKIFNGKKFCKSQKMFNENGERVAYRHAKNCLQRGKF